MDLKNLEAAVRSVVDRGTKKALEALERHGELDVELATAAGSLATRLDVGPTAPDDPNKPWY